MLKPKKTVKKCLSWLLALVMILSVIPVAVLAAPADLSISSAKELLAFSEKVNGGEDFSGKTVELTADIDLGGEGSEWTPIGSASSAFAGTFDGNNHVISGLYISSGSNAGLFGKVNGGTIKNVTVKGSVSGSSSVAGVVGYLNAGNIINCGNNADVSGSSGVGGVVGYVGGASTVSGCYNSGNVSGSTGYIGGVSGQHWRAGKLENCYNTGKVSGPASVGGVAGGHKAASPELVNCYNAGTVEDSAGYQNNIGALIGATRGTAENCYYLSVSSFAATGNKGDIDGAAKVDSVTETMLGSAFIKDEEGINSGNPVLSWQGKTPDVIIASYSQLKAFADSVNDGNSYEGKLIRLNVNIELGGANNPWTPIGSSSSAFAGTFDGNNHVISGLYISSGSNAGLFGKVNGGTIKNVTVKGSVSGSSSVAGVVGYLNAGNIINCGNNADVSGSSGVGGVVGYVGGASTVSGCYNSGNVSGSTGYIGGVSGQHWRAGKLENCYNTGKVSGPASVGGVAGGHKAASPELVNCYNAGTVEDSAGYQNNIGALIGATRGTAENCYYLSVSSFAATGNKGDIDGAAKVDSVTETMLGSAFVSGDTNPKLAWESLVSADKPVRPSFSEGTELSAKLSGYIKEAVKSSKTKAGLTSADTLLGNESYMAGASSTATDWMALAMGRYGYFDSADGKYTYLIDDGTGYTDYLNAMKSYVEKTYTENGGTLHSVKATEWHRGVVAIAALGGDPTSFGIYNGQPINLIADGSYNCKVKGGPGKQGINGWIWGLIALDTGVYEVPSDAAYQRELFIKEILKMQLTDGVDGNKYGGWVLGGYGSSSDVDITAMAIQALAPYYNDDTVYTYKNEISGEEVSKTVRQCVDEAFDRLGSMMNDKAGFTSWNTDNSESIAQVIVALTSVGIDPQKDSRFITSDGLTLLDGLLRFRDTNGGFCHVVGSGWNSMANDQATYALVAYWRFENKMRALYDMRGDWSVETKAAITDAVSAIDALPLPTDANYKSAAKSALAKFRAVPENERRYVNNYSALVSAIELVGGEGELDSNTPYITSIAVTKAPDKTEYYDGDSFDAAGMEVTVYYSDGAQKPVTDYEIISGDSLEVGTQRVCIKSGKLKTFVTVTVKDKIPWEGLGSETSPYLISTAEDLYNLSYYVNTKLMATTGVYFKMTDNIDLSDYDNWTPIGSDRNQFDGVFDGDGYVIDNLTSLRGGLFGTVCQNAVIKNVGVASGEIGKENTYTSFLGGIAKWSNGADFINCWNGADIYGSGYMGGIVGTVRDGGKSNITGCYNVGSLYASSGHAGGIVGHLDTTRRDTSVEVTIDNCYNLGSINGIYSLGGIVGQAQDGHTIVNCYNAGKITSASDGQAGAIAGSLTSDNRVQECYYDSSVTENGIGNGDGSTTGETTEFMKSPEFLALLGEKFKEDEYSLVNGGYPLLYWQKTFDADDVNEVVEKINDIGDVTADSGVKINEARNAYDNLDDDLKPYVSNLDVLLNAEKELSEIISLKEAKKTALEQLESYKDASDYALNREAFNKALEKGMADISAAKNKDEVNTALIKAKAALDEIPTDSSLGSNDNKNVNVPSVPGTDGNTSNSGNTADTDIKGVSIPKTGRIGNAAVTFLMFSSFAAAMAVTAKRKKDEE